MSKAVTYFQLLMESHEATTKKTMVQSWQGVWRDVVDNYSPCVKCLHGLSNNMKCFGRGNALDPLVVFIGEGPGTSEDTLGLPFVGPAGKLLDKAIKDAGMKQCDCFFTNLLLCKPVNSEGKICAPGNRDVMACALRLGATLRIVKPTVLVLLGLVPQGLWDLACRNGGLDPEGYVRYDMKHPAYVLRCGGVGSNEYTKYVKAMKGLKDLYEF